MCLVLIPIIRRAACALALGVLAGCSSGRAPARHAVDTHADDACAVCGMYLDDSGGPRAEAWVAGHAAPLVFDSTRDFFAYVVQPENQAGLQDMFVQDSSHLDWQKPSRAAVTFIDARSAFYVAWQPLPGSMGPTLAPFPTPVAATAFVRAHGGAILRFPDITPALIAALAYHCPSGASPAAAPRCLPDPAASAAQPDDPNEPYPPGPHPRRLVARSQP